MSSSYGSPALKKRGRGKGTGVRKTEDAREGEKKKEGKVTGIRNFFESKADVSKNEIGNCKPDNNNAGWEGATPMSTMICSSVRNNTQREPQEKGSHLREENSPE